MKKEEVVVWAQSFSTILSAPKVTIGNKEVVDLRQVDVDSRMLQAAHEMGWQVMYNVNKIDERINLVCVTEITSIIANYFYEFAVKNKMTKIQLAPLFREVTAISRA